MEGDTCSICGGEGRVRGPYGRTSVCSACGGSGRRSLGGEDLIRDVTKTKPSHYLPKNQTDAQAKQTWPTTLEAQQLATEVRDCPTCPPELRDRLVREIIEYEGSHGRCTKTFTKKVRKQLRATGAA